MKADKIFLSKILPCFGGFFAVFKLHKGILTCVLSLFSFFSSFPPLFPSFFQVLLQIHLDTNSQNVYPGNIYISVFHCFVLFRVYHYNYKSKDPADKSVTDKEEVRCGKVGREERRTTRRKGRGQR